jgi:carboxypeptidase family protein
MCARIFSTLIALILGAVLSNRPLLAQISGDLEIKVTDSSAAVIPGATVMVRSRDMGTMRSGITDAVGAVRVSQLAVGSYQIEVAARGFNTFKTIAAVASGAATTVPVMLEISTATQEIVVMETANALNTVNAQLQNSVETRDITTLPLVGNDVMALAGNAAGVIPVAPNNPFLGLGSFNSNGGRGRGNNITVDNATATDVSTTGEGGTGTLPTDAIKEFNVITNNFNAEYGRNSSAQVQIISKGGGNEFHGDAFEFFKNSWLNARDYFDTTGQPTVTRNNDWGGYVGGPVKRNKIFFFGTYEQQKIRGSGGTNVATVPTTAQVSAATDPTAVALLKQLNVPVTDSGNISQSAPNATDFYSYSGRVDVNLTNNDLLFLRGGTSHVNQQAASLTFIDSNLATNGASVIDRDANATISETHTFSANTVNQFLASYGRISPNFTPLQKTPGPEIQFLDGTDSFGTWNGLPQGRVQNTFQYNDMVSHTRGKHTLKAGVDINRIQSNGVFDANVRGTYVFLSLDDFLAGNPFQYSQRFGNSVRGYRVSNEYFFAQDDYKVSRSLTVNFGVRLEVSGGVSEVNNILSNIDFHKNDALGGAGTGPFGAFTTGGTAFHTTRNWAPRLGFAWNPGNGKLVVRGGYGMTYDFIYLNPISNLRFLPPFMFQFVLPQTGFGGSNTFANLAAGSSAFQQQGFATVGTFGTTIRNFGSIAPVDQGLRNPQVQQWSLTVERELPFGLVGRASYVGTKTNYLQRTHDINTIQPGLFTPPQTADEQAAMQAAGVFRTINAELNPGPTSPSIRIDPRFNRGQLLDSSANSNFNSLQLFAERRFRRGYSFSVAYTYSKSIDDVSDALGILANDTSGQQNPFNNRNNRAVSAFDVPQRLVIAHNFSPEWGAGASNRFMRALVRGWTFGGIFQAQSGVPINLFAGSQAGVSDALLLGGSASQRPDVVGPINLHFQPDTQADNPNKVTDSGLAKPLVGHFGDLGRNVFRLNPLVNADMTLGKDFKITERVTTRLQWQVFNVFNNTTFNLGGISWKLSAPSTFGYYEATDTNSRNMLLTLRFLF